MPKPGYKGRRKFNTKIQDVAVAAGFYKRVWPDYHVQPIDSLPNDLAKTIDIGGGDIAFFANDGHLIFAGHRFRRYAYIERGYLDFTIRESEYRRHLAAVQNGGFVPGFYACGYANKTEDELLHFVVLKYQQMMKDIATGAFRVRFKQTRPGQENFYYVPFRDIPEKYMVFRHPDNGKRQQMKLAF